jgi:RNA polymerase sigma-70 factor (ECF subfamily)
MPETDETLMLRVAEGREDAFRELVGRYEAKARRYCYRIFRDAHVAEDAAQDVFLKLFLNADRYEPTGRFNTFFYRVLGNLCYDRLRFEKRRAPVRANTMDGHLLDGYEDGAAGGNGNGRFPAPEDALVAVEEKAQVRTALAALPPSLKEAILLREFEGLKYREIADVMDVTLNEVKVLIHRARKQLAKRLTRILAKEGRP